MFHARGFLLIESLISLVVALFLCSLCGHWLVTLLQLHRSIRNKRHALHEASNELERILIRDRERQDHVCYKLYDSDLPGFYWVKVAVPIKESGDMVELRGGYAQ